MNTFRLARGEFKKIFLRPSVYIMAFFLAVVLVATVFMYSPTNRWTSKDSAEALSGSNSSAIITSFNKENITKYQPRITDMSTMADFYLNDAENYSIKTIYNKNAPQGTYLNDFKQSYNVGYSYLMDKYKDKTATQITQTIVNELNTALSNFRDKVNLVNTEMSRLILAQEKHPTLVITRKTQEKIKSLLDLLLEETIPLETTPTPSITEAYNIHQAKWVNLEASKFLVNLQDEFAKIKDVKTDENLIAEIKEKYSTNLYHTKLKTFYDKLNPGGTIAAGLTKAKTIEYTSSYLGSINNAEHLFYNKLYLSLIEPYNDAQVNSFYKLNTNPFFTEPPPKTYKYAINEEITMYEYLWANNKYDHSYNFGFNTNLTGGSETNMFDFAFYAMEIASFFIILFTLILGAGMIAGEYSGRTIKMLAIRPFSRGKIISAKLLATLFFTIIFTLFSVAASFIIGYFLYGYSATPALLIFNATSVTVMSPILLFLLYVLTLLLKAFIFCMLGICISAIFKSNMAAVLLGIAFYLFGPLFAVIAPASSVLLFLPFTNINLYQYFGFAYAGSGNNFITKLFTTPTIFSNSILISSLMTLSILALITILTYTIFKYRDIT